MNPIAHPVRTSEWTNEIGKPGEMALRDLALTVEERGPHQFFWLLIEASDNDALEAIHYKPIHAAATPQPSYSSALVMGADAMRRLVEAQHRTGSP